MNQLMIKKKNELTTNKKKGFTLIELIIVIAIIAILAAVAIPKFGAVKKDANLAADKANAKIIATAVATAISNGDTGVYDTETGNVTTSKITAYIDGGVVPKPKSVTGNFVVTYDAPTTNGVVVKLPDTGNTTVYPAS